MAWAWPATTHVDFHEASHHPAGRKSFRNQPFPNLRKLVFADIERYSPEFARALTAEAATDAPATSKAPSPFSPVLRLGAYVGDELIGWSFGWVERGQAFYSANSGVIDGYRRQGIYTKLIEAVCEHAQSMGAVLVRSQHSVLNNPVIIAKLRAGFRIAGLSQSAQMGTLVELVRHFSDARAEVFASRAIPFTAEKR